MLAGLLQTQAPRQSDPSGAVACGCWIRTLESGAAAILARLWGMVTGGVQADRAWTVGSRAKVQHDGAQAAPDIGVGYQGQSGGSPR